MKILLTTVLAMILAVHGYSQINTYPYPEIGDVGIGTASPESKLHVNGTTTTNLISFKEGTSYLGYLGRGGAITGGWSQYPSILSLNYSGRDFAIGGWSKSNSTWMGAALYINSDNNNVGIGTTAPVQKLSVTGNVNITNPTAGNYYGFGEPGINEYNTIGSSYSAAGLILAHGLKPHTSSSSLIYSFPSMSRSAIILGSGFNEGGIEFYTKPSSTEELGTTFSDDPRMVITDGGKLGVGVTVPEFTIDVNGDGRIAKSIITNSNSPFANSSILYSQTGMPNIFGVDGSWSTKYFGLKADGTFVTMGGNVGIGTTDPQGYKLAVAGKIRATEIKVEALPWPDFVFQSSYKLPDLKATEQFIKQNKHLPEIPSAAEVTKDGINLGEMNAKLLQKIEELTLYMIEQNKQSSELRKTLESQSKLVQEQNERITSLEKQIKK